MRRLADVVEHAGFVVGGDAFGDGDDQVDAGGGGLHDRVGREGRRYKRHCGVGICGADSLGHSVEYRDTVQVAPAFAGSDPCHEVGAVITVAKSVELAFLAGQALN